MYIRSKHMEEALVTFAGRVSCAIGNRNRPVSVGQRRFVQFRRLIVRGDNPVIVHRLLPMLTLVTYIALVPRIVALLGKSAAC